MTWLVASIETGTAIDWILGVVVIEAVLLMAYRFLTRTGLGVGPVLSLLLPGACLLLALRCALTNAGAVSIAAFLSAAFIAHLADVALRWRASAARQGPGASVNSSARGA